MAGEIRLGGAYIDFSARSAGFQRAMSGVSASVRRQRQAFARLRRDLRPLERGFRRVARSATRLGGALAAAAGVGGAGLMIKRATELGARLYELSQSTGLSVERLQGLRRVFEGDGVAAEKAERALQRFLVRLGEFRQGRGEAKEAFETLDLTGFGAGFETTEDALRSTVEAISQIEDRALKATIAYQIFGRQGADLLVVFERGGKALIDQANAMQRLGTISTAQAAQLKSLEQSFTDFRNAVEANVSAAVANASGHIQEIVDRMTAWASTLEERLTPAIQYVLGNLDALGEAFARVGAVLVAGPIFRVAGAFAALSKQGLFLRSVAGALLTAFGALLRLLRKFIIVQLVIDGVLILVDVFPKLQEAIESISFQKLVIGFLEGLSIMLNGWFSLHTRMLARVRNFIQNALILISGFSQTWSALIEGRIGDLADNIGFDDEFDRIRQNNEQFRKDIESGKFNARISLAELMGFTPAEINNARRTIGKAGSDIADAFSAAFQRRVDAYRELSALLSGDIPDIELPDIPPVDIQPPPSALGGVPGLPDPEQLERARQGIERITESQRRLQRLQSGVASSFENAFDRMIFGAERFSDSIRQLAMELIRLVAHQAILQPLAGSIAGGLGNIFGGLFGGSSASVGLAAGGGIGAGVAPAAAGSGFGLPLLQHGGRAGRGLAVVGEAGPELVDFQQPGRVYSTDKLRQVAAGGEESRPIEIVNNFNIDSTDGPGVRRALAEAIPLINGAIYQGVTRDLRRPSALRSASRS